MKKNKPIMNVHDELNTAMRNMYRALLNDTDKSNMYGSKLQIFNNAVWEVVGRKIAVNIEQVISTSLENKL